MARTDFVLDKVRGTIAKYRLLEPRERVLSAFSGGADSSALIIVLKELGYGQAAAHVDHRMRPDSGSDEVHCRWVARHLGIDFYSRRSALTLRTEADARQARYELLEEMAVESGSHKIATGHTRNDDAETVAMRLERGGFGLGIPPVRGRVVRPLIELSRDETEMICTDFGIPFLVDPTNRDLSITRNRVRASLKPADVERLLDVGREARTRSEEAVAEITRSSRGLVRIEGDLIAIERAGLVQLGEDHALGVLRFALGSQGVAPSVRLLKDVHTKVAAATGKSLDLPGGLTAWSEPDVLLIGEAPAPSAPPDAVIEMGSNNLEAWNIELIVGGPEGERFDGGLLEFPLMVRGRQPGDRFHPLGAPGSKKLQDFFVDEKVPRRTRSSVPLLVSGGRIVWVVGMRIADPFKITPRTTKVLNIELRDLASPRSHP